MDSRGVIYSIRYVYKIDESISTEMNYSNAEKELTKFNRIVVESGAPLKSENLKTDYLPSEEFKEAYLQTDSVTADDFKVKGDHSEASYYKSLNNTIRYSVEAD